MIYDDYYYNYHFFYDYGYDDGEVYFHDDDGYDGYDDYDVIYVYGEICDNHLGNHPFLRRVCVYDDV